MVNLVLFVREACEDHLGDEQNTRARANFASTRWAELRNRCRRAGVQVGTIDALIAQLCVRHQLMLLTTDRDFDYVAKHCALKLWRA